MTDNGPPTWARALSVVLPAALGLPLLLASGAYVPRTLGIFLCLVAIYGLLRVLHAMRPLEPLTIRRWTLPCSLSTLAPIVIVSLAAGLLWPGLLGKMVMSQDHPVHLTRAWHFVTHMLAKGRLSGWSDLWFAGWPAGEDYPPGGDWWVSTVYLGTFGLLGWEAAYAIAFIGVLAACGLAVYHFGRRHFGATAGLLAGLFYLLDRGQYREGGWSYTVWWGVWPQVLSTAFTVLAFSTLERAISRGRPRDFAVCGLCTGFAVLSHPVAVIYLGLGAPVYILARALGTRSNEKAGRIVMRTAAAFGLGALLAAFWIIPFSAKSAWMAKYGELWKSLPQMAQGLWRGSLFANVAPPLIWLGLLGGAVAVWRRNFGGIFLAGFGLLLLLLSSSTIFHELQLVELSPAFGQVQFQRLSIAAKICFFLLAGYALQLVFRKMTDGEGQATARSYWQRHALVVLVLLVVAPFVEPVLEAWGHTYGAEIGHPKTRDDFYYWDDYRAFLKWSRGLAPAQENGFFRIAYERPYHDHSLAAAPVYNGLPAFKVGYTPCTNFVHKPKTAEPELYRLLSVKYVLSIGPSRTPRLALVKRFGSINVYRNLDYTAQRYTLQGPGTVTVEAFEREHVRLRIAGATDHSRLILHRSNYPNWKATHNGQPLPITTAALSGHEMFIGLPAKNGTIDVDYTWPASNVFGAVLTWLGLGVLAVMVLTRYRPALTAPLTSRLLPLARWAEQHGVAIGVGVIVLGLAAVGLRSGSGKGEQAQTHSLMARLDQAQVELIRDGQISPCHRRKERFVCSNQSWNYVGLVSHQLSSQFRRCIWAHPVEGALLRVRFPKTTLGSALVGHHGLLDSAVLSFPNGAPVDLVISIDGREVRKLQRPNQVGWSYFSVDTSDLAGKTAEVAFTISTSRSAGRHYCFDATVKP